MLDLAVLASVSAEVPPANRDTVEKGFPELEKLV